MIPAIHTKTTAFFVDDDKAFLNDLNDLLPQSHFFRLFTNPLEALEEVKAHSQRQTDTSSLYGLKSANFGQALSVIVVDHRMKPIDGIEFCRRLDSHAPKRIMLTSHATKDLAIKALNDKLIDIFLLKTEDDILTKLSLAMHKCTMDFFNEVSTSIDGFKNRRNPLANERFAEFFIKFCEEKKIQSHHCFHDFYNIVLKDDHGKETYMTIYDDEYIDDLLVSQQAKSAQPDLIDRVIHKQAAPCFKDIDSPLIPDGIIWEKFMVPLTRLGDNLAVAIDQRSI